MDQVFTVSELQSIIATNATQISAMESIVADLKDIARTNVGYGYTEKAKYYFNRAERYREQIKTMAKHQKKFKTQMKSLAAQQSTKVIENQVFDSFFVRVGGVDDSTKTQNALFVLGYKWTSGDVKPLAYYHTTIEVNTDGTLTYGCADEHTVEKVLLPSGEFTSVFETGEPEIVEQIEPVSQPTPAIIPTAGIGDIHSGEKGAGARYNAGKADYSLIPLCTMEGEARVWTKGAIKYSAHNWMKGMKWSAPLASALRHLAKWQSGEDFDEESGEAHLDHVMCNIRMLVLYSKTYKEGDDRPKQWLQA